MADFIHLLVEIIAQIHNKILTLNDSYEMYLSDKMLHFIIMGILGMGIFFLIYPAFVALSKNHIIVIAWFYVFTVMVVLTFAIEIGQGYTNTGTMDMNDVVAGLGGFMALFIVFIVIRFIFLEITKIFKDIAKQLKKKK